MNKYNNWYKINKNLIKPLVSIRTFVTWRQVTFNEKIKRRKSNKNSGSPRDHVTAKSIFLLSPVSFTLKGGDVRLTAAPRTTHFSQTTSSFNSIPELQLFDNNIAS